MRRARATPTEDSNSRQWSTRPASFMRGSVGTMPRMSWPTDPPRDKKLLRRQLQQERQTMSDREQRAEHLQRVLRVWLVSRAETTIGAYWPIKGEFDALPALYRWGEADPSRRIGLPV